MTTASAASRRPCRSSSRCCAPATSTSRGTYYSARDCELRPRGPRPAGPPILIGGSGERVLRLTARYADAWNADRQNDVAGVQALNARVDAACHDVGRDPATLGRVIGIQVDLLNEARVSRCSHASS